MLEEQGLVEIAELSRSFNRMTQRLTEIRIIARWFWRGFRMICARPSPSCG